MRLRRGLNLGLLLTGGATLLSGVLIQVRYHMHHGSTGLVWGLDYPDWAMVHQVASMLLLVIAAWHLWVNRKSLPALLGRTGRWRRQAFVFFALFVFAALTALAARMVGLVFDSRFGERALVEIHDKLALPMSVLMILHTWQRRARLLP